MSRRALLLGAGHAHLYTLKRCDEYRRRGHSLAVCGDRSFWYSGLATGMLGGAYDPEMDQIDIAALAHAGGAVFVDGQATSIDPGSCLVLLNSGAKIHYDVLSLNLGSVVEALPGERDNHAVYSVKPIRRLRALRGFLETCFSTRPSNGTASIHVIVAGGGTTGCEIAANIAGLAERHAGRAAITIVTEGSRVLENAPQKASRALAGALRARGIEIRCDTRVVRVDERQCSLSDGAVLHFDALVNATGLKPSPLIRDSGLTVDDAGALLVDAHLRSVGDRRIFGGGDCIAIEGRPLPKVGVYAIREAPVLHHNLLAALDERPTRAFKPQRRFLSIMNLGDGTALAMRDGLWWQGRAAFRLKDWIDRRFMRRYR